MIIIVIIVETWRHWQVSNRILWTANPKPLPAGHGPGTPGRLCWGKPHRNRWPASDTLRPISITSRDCSAVERKTGEIGLKLSRREMSYNGKCFFFFILFQLNRIAPSCRPTERDSIRDLRAGIPLVPPWRSPRSRNDAISRCSNWWRAGRNRWPPNFQIRKCPICRERASCRAAWPTFPNSIQFNSFF